MKSALSTLEKGHFQRMIFSVQEEVDRDILEFLNDPVFQKEKETAMKFAVGERVYDKVLEEVGTIKPRDENGLSGAPSDLWVEFDYGKSGWVSRVSLRKMEHDFAIGDIVGDSLYRGKKSGIGRVFSISHNEVIIKYRGGDVKAIPCSQAVQLICEEIDKFKEGDRVCEKSSGIAGTVQEVQTNEGGKSITVKEDSGMLCHGFCEEWHMENKKEDRETHSQDGGGDIFTYETIKEAARTLKSEIDKQNKERELNKAITEDIKMMGYYESDDEQVNEEALTKKWRAMIEECDNVPPEQMRVKIKDRVNALLGRCGVFRNPVHSTWTAKFETDDGQILKIPPPDNRWEVNEKIKCHKLAFVSATKSALFCFDIIAPGKRGGETGKTCELHHEGGFIWFKDMARHIEGIHCIELVRWSARPIMHEIPQVPYDYFCPSKCKPNPDWPNGSRPRRVIQGS